MDFPNVRPATRRLDPGDWPIKTFNAQDGAEVRILYGNRRTRMKLSLSFSNLQDTTAELFEKHFISVKGTYETFTLANSTAVLAGWTGTADVITAQSTGNRWRYESPPVLESVRPGISSVTVSLIGVI